MVIKIIIGMTSFSSIEGIMHTKKCVINVSIRKYKKIKKQEKRKRLFLYVCTTVDIVLVMIHTRETVL